MTICPIAVVAGCRKCPAYPICPLKTVLGDAAKPDKDADATAKAAPRADANRRQKK